MEDTAYQEQSSGLKTEPIVSKFTFVNSATQGVGAIADQGFFAISNFALNLILARRMATTEFGAFSAAFATFVLIATVYTAVVTEPMLIFALSTWADCQKSYVKRVSTLHWRSALLVSLAVTAVGAIRYAIHPQLSSILAYVGWALAAPLVLWLWFARRTAYITRTPHRAAIAGAGYLVCMTALLVIFGDVVPKYPLLVCLLFALPSMIIAPLLRLKVPLKDADQNATTDTSNLWTSHWSYGRWASIGGLCSAVTAPIYFFVLPLDGCAAYRAIMNVPMPLLQTYTALGPAFIALFTPLRGNSQFARAVTQSLIVVSTAALALGLAVSVYSENILRILYSDKYTGYAGQLRPLMIYSCLVSVTVVLDSAMRSMGKVRIATLASLTAVVVSFAVGIPAAIRFGVQGVGYGLVASQASALGVLGVVWLRTNAVSANSMKLASSSTLSNLTKPGVSRI